MVSLVLQGCHSLMRLISCAPVNPMHPRELLYPLYHTVLLKASSPLLCRVIPLWREITLQLCSRLCQGPEDHSAEGIDHSLPTAGDSMGEQLPQLLQPVLMHSGGGAPQL